MLAWPKAFDVSRRPGTNRFAAAVACSQIVTQGKDGVNCKEISLLPCCIPEWERVPCFLRPAQAGPEQPDSATCRFERSRIRTAIGCHHALLQNGRRPVERTRVERWEERDPLRRCCAVDLARKEAWESAVSAHGPGHIRYTYARQRPSPAGCLKRTDRTALLSARIASSS